MMKKRKPLWDVDMFHKNIGKSTEYFDELFENLKTEKQKMDEIPEDKKENRSKKLIDDLLTGYGVGLMLKEQENSP